MPEDDQDTGAIESYEDLENAIENKEADYKTRKLLKEADLILARLDAEGNASNKSEQRSNAESKAKEALENAEKCQNDVLRAHANALLGHIAFKKEPSYSDYEKEKTRLTKAEDFYKAFLNNVKSLVSSEDGEPTEAWSLRAKYE